MKKQKNEEQVNNYGKGDDEHTHMAALLILEAGYVKKSYHHQKKWRYHLSICQAQLSTTLIAIGKVWNKVRRNGQPHKQGLIVVYNCVFRSTNFQIRTKKQRVPLH